MEKINKKIELIKENIYNLNKKKLSKKFVDEIVFLENIRFYKQEEDNDNDFQNNSQALEIYLLMMHSLAHIGLMHRYVKLQNIYLHMLVYN